MSDAAFPIVSAEERLRQRPCAHGFFQAARLIYRIGGFSPQQSPWEIGPLRFATPQSLSFPASEIQDLAPVTDVEGAAYRMTVNFMGLTGPSGVLPRHYTEWLIERRKARDPAPQDFLDLFNQRLLGLFWRAWAKYRADIGQEFGFSNNPLEYVLDLVGMGTPSLRRLAQPARQRKAEPAAAEPGLPGSALIFYSGLLSQRPHGVGTVSQVLGDFIGAPVAIVSCVGHWQPVPAADRSRLGRDSARLADSCVLGSHVWDRQTTLLIQVGPLRLAGFRALLPDGRRLRQVVELARFLTGIAIDLRLQLRLAAADVRPLALASAGAERPRLGWSCWLAGRRRVEPADECEFHFAALAPGA
jgi:type VI secretion system protein ImpH